MLVPAVAAFALFVYRIGHKVLVYITIHCIHFVLFKRQMEDTIIGLNSLVSLMCAANEAVLSVVHVGKALAQLSRMHIHSSCCHVDPDCIAH